LTEPGNRLAPAIAEHEHIQQSITTFKNNAISKKEICANSWVHFNKISSPTGTFQLTVEHN